ncbi:MAG: hypothetical protein K2P14_05415 [Anaeroplasmataceae bacterium]|nr:hypothetical protein [Anaeroplasmataceae bacterium]
MLIESAYRKLTMGDCMHILISNLLKNLKMFEKILIYGTGNYANIIYPMLKKAGLKEKICSFVVTGTTDISQIDGIPVKSLSELKDIDTRLFGVLIATGKEYEKDIERGLSNFGFAQVLKLTDYILVNNSLEKLINLSDEQFLELVIEEVTWKKINVIDELEKKIKSFKEAVIEKEKMGVDKNTIIFITGDLAPRSIKFIGALLKKKNVIVLLYGCPNELLKDSLSTKNIKFLECSSIVELLYCAMLYMPLVYYCEPKWGDCSLVETIIEHKKLFGKIVFAPYDILNDGYKYVSEKQKLSERFCLENADGIVWRWFSKEFLEDMKGIVCKGRSILFLDYCNGYDMKRDDESSTKSGALRICFVSGGTYGVFDNESCKNDVRYTEMAKMKYIMEKIGKRDDCIFHVYIGSANEQDRKNADLLSMEYPNFKVFWGTKYDDLISNISEYDYGCYWSTDGVEIPLLEADENGFTGSSYENSVPNRYFDYIDAGLPIIAVQPKKICNYLEKFGVVVKMTISDIDIDFLKKSKSVYKENVKKAKKELLIDNHIQKLIDFFNEL